jgi:hypothetical protein
MLNAIRLISTSGWSATSSSLTFSTAIHRARRPRATPAAAAKSYQSRRDFGLARLFGRAMMPRNI